MLHSVIDWSLEIGIRNSEQIFVKLFKIYETLQQVHSQAIREFYENYKETVSQKMMLQEVAERPIPICFSVS